MSAEVSFRFLKHGILPLRRYIMCNTLNDSSDIHSYIFKPFLLLD